MAVWCLSEVTVLSSRLIANAGNFAFEFWRRAAVEVVGGGSKAFSGCF